MRDFDQATSYQDELSHIEDREDAQDRLYGRSPFRDELDYYPAGEAGLMASRRLEMREAA